MSPSRNCAALAAGLALFAAPAFADPIVDQEQTLIDAAAGFLGIGGDSEQQLAQTLTVGVTGDLVALNLPVTGCGGGDLVIEIRNVSSSGLPTGAVLAVIRRAPEDVPGPYAGLVTFELDEPLRVRRSQRLAFTVRTEGAGSFCSYATSVEGDTYAGGESFFDSRPNPPGWLASKEFPGPSDLAFQTLMDNLAPPPPPSSGGCLIPTPGGGPSGFAPNLPVCRCLRDEGLREFRCALLHPDFFAIRRIPWPLPDAPITETWEFYAIAPLDGSVRMTLSGGGIQKPLTKSFGLKSKLGKLGKLGGPETLVVNGILPKDLLAIPAVATFDYDMKDASSEWETNFSVDRSIDPDQFEQ